MNTRKMKEQFWEFLDKVGFSIAPALASIFGGIISSYLDDKDETWIEAGIKIAAGALVAGYSTGLILQLTALDAKYAAGMGFAIGLFGMRIAKKITIYLEDHSLQDIINDISKLIPFGKWRNK